MTQLLKDYLTASLGGYEARRKLSEAPHIRKLGYIDTEGKQHAVRELIMSGDLEGTNLIQTEVNATVVEGARLAKAFMDLLPIVRKKGDTYKWPYGETGGYAEIISDAGAEVPMREEDYGAATYDAKLIGVRPMITDSMIEGAQADVIETNIKYAGECVMNRAERVCLSEILQNSGLEHDTGGANQGLKAVAKAVTLLKGSGMIPDAVVMTPNAEGLCMQDVVIPQSPGTDNIVRGQGIPDGYLGLKWRVCNVVDDSASYSWAYAADGNIGMLVLDTGRAGGIFMPRDLTVKDLKDPIHDMTGMTVTMRMDCKTHVANGACRVEY